MSTVLIIVLSILGASLLWALLAYNSLIRRKNQVSEAWSDIDVQLKRRHDLIPNLLETVKGYAGHERTTLDSVTAARTQALAATSPHAQAQAENVLSGTLKTLFAVAESYPDLKANTNFLELQRELSDTENKIQASRRFYNSAVRDYLTALETVPTNIIARSFGFTAREFFELDDDATREVPSISFDKK